MTRLELAGISFCLVSVILVVVVTLLLYVPKRKRKTRCPEQLTATASEPAELIVLCDDGTIWVACPKIPTGWIQLPDIPQTKENQG